MATNVFEYAANKWQPIYGATNNMKPRILKFQFGDGYEQRLRDGLNTLLKSWTVTFKLTPDEGNVAKGLLEGWAGVTAFEWDDPDGDTIVCVCEDWSYQYNEGWYNLSATFRQVPEVAV